MNSMMRPVHLLGLLFGIAGTVMSSAEVPPVRIMPLGDSITLGCCSGTSNEGGYRTRLYSLLADSGYQVDFVGTQSDANNPELPDRDHEGHGGSRIDDIRSGLGSWLKETEDPDVILLHIGTNDFSANSELGAAQNKLRSLLIELSAARPNSKIIVSTLIPRTDDAAIESIQLAYNQSVPQIVNEQASLGRQVSWVDVHDALDPDDLSEGVHPNDSGYQKMAGAWLPAITQVITPLGTLNPPVISKVDAREDLTHVAVTFSKPVDDSAINLSNYALSGGVAILHADLEPYAKRTVVLTTTPQSEGTAYTLAVNGVRDRTPLQNAIPVGATREFTSRALLDGSFEANGEGWTSEGSNQVAEALPNTPATDGAKLMVFNGADNPPDGVVSQTVATIPGETYQLGFDVGIFGQSTQPQSLQVTVEGNELPLLALTEQLSGADSGSTMWKTKSYNFVANSTTTSLTFEDTSSSTYSADLLLDDVRLNLQVTPTLTVSASPLSGVPVSASPVDLNSSGDGITEFTRSYNESTVVDLTAPSSTGLYHFQKWQRDGLYYSASAATSVTMDANHSMSAVYNMLQNGGFESGAVVVGSVTQLDNWSVTGGPIGYIEDADYATPEASRLVVFNGGGDAFGGTVFQSFTTVPGEAYEVDYQIGIFGTAGQKQQLQVAVSGSPLPLGVDEVTAVAGPAQWVQKHYTFVADSTTTTLTFTDQSAALGGQAGSCDLLLDDVRVAIASSNTAPIAVNDSYSTSQNVTLDVAASGVLANDTDAESNPLTAVLVSGPAHGGLTLNSDGSFTYIPASGYFGPDSFSYKANDAAADSNVAIVSIDVSATESSLLENGSFENGAASEGGVSVLDNWVVTGSPFGYVADASYTATDGLRITVFNGAGDSFGGTISQSFATTPGATYSLEFDMGIFGAVGKMQRLRVDLSGSASPFAIQDLTASAGPAQWSAKSYTFVASGPTTLLTFTDDSAALGDAASSSDLLLDHVRISPAASSNTAPVATDDSHVLEKNAQLVIAAPGVLGNDTDAESSPLTAVIDTTPAHGTVLLVADGGFTYTPDTDYVGPDSFTYHANDGNLASNVATVSLVVNAPAIGPFTNGSFEAGTTGWTVTGNQFVIDNSAPYLATNGTKLMVFNGGNMTPDGVVSQTFATVPGQSYFLEFDMGVLAANSSEQRLHVSLTGTAAHVSQVESAFGNGAGNSAWVAKSFPFTADSNSTTVTFSDQSLATEFIDLLLDNVRITVGASKTLSLSSTGVGSVSMSVTPTDLNGSGNGITDFTRSYADGAIVGVSAPVVAGGGTFVKWQKDGVDFSLDPATNITMDANYTLNAVYFVNSAPVAVADTYTTGQNTQLVVPAAGVLANDTDADLAPLSATLDTAPANGTLTLDANGGFTYTPSNNFQGIDTFSYHANDGALDSNVATVSISVVAPSLLANGSFEFGVAGWTVTGNQTVIDSVDAYVPTDGTKLMVFNGGQSSPNAVISQTFATTPGQPYLLEFDMGVIAGNLNEQQLYVTVSGNGSLLTHTETVMGNGLGNAQWASKSFAFVADSANTTLSLNDLSPSTNAIDLLLDNVRVSVGVARTLNVTSTPPTTATVNISPADLGGDADGVTQFSRTYIHGASVTLTAPQVAAGGNFLKWQKNGSDASTQISITVLMDANYTMNAVYAPNAAPVAVNDALGVDEDAELVLTAPGVLGNDTDPESGAFTAVLDSGPSHGVLALSPDGSLTYTPAADYQGVDSFTYHTFDGELASGIATVSITIAPVNDAPLASEQSATTDEDIAVAITLAGSDIDGDPLIYPISVQPEHGTLSGTAPDLVYTPNPDFSGSDEFTFTSNDGSADSAPTKVFITVNPVADPPLATPQSINMVGGMSAGVTLAGTDPDGDPITFSVSSNPSHGTLSGIAPNLVYTPIANYQGSDSFTFVANDGTSDSSPALVSITVGPVLVNGSFEDGITGWTATGNYQIVTSVTQPPNQRFSTDGSKLLVLNGGQQPPNAVISQSFQTTPGQPYLLEFDHGFQSFNSNEQRLQILVTGSSTLISQTESLFGNGSGISVWSARSYSFTADSETTTLTFKDLSPTGNLIDMLVDHVRVTAKITRTLTVSTSPESGVNVTVSPLDISGAGNGSGEFTRTYLDGVTVNLTTPVAVGAMNFQKWQKDGIDYSTTAATSLELNANHALTAIYIPNEPPVAGADSYACDEDTPMVVAAANGVLANDSDPEGVAISAVLDEGPTHGSLVFNPDGSFSYTPVPNFFGLDSFTYHVSDGVVNSAIQTVTISVNPVNDAPVGVAESYSTDEDVALVVPASGVLANDTDTEGDALTVNLVNSPAHGSLTLDADGGFSYQPSGDYNGPDSFTYEANDGAASSSVVTVSLLINPVNDLPVAVAQSLSVDEDDVLPIVLAGEDVDGDSLSYTVGSPSHGILGGTAPNLTYTPDANYNGSDEFSFSVNDGQVESGSVLVTITVSAVNDPPVAAAQLVELAEDGSKAILLAGSDPEESALTFSVTAQPLHGTLSGAAPDLIYTPDANFHGNDSFSFTTNDGLVDSAPAVVGITVTAVNDAPQGVAQPVEVNEDGSVSLTLSGTDIDEDTLTYSFGTPAHGTLSGTAPDLTYQADANYHGSDSFTFTVNDGTVDSASALVTITVAPVNDAPVGVADSYGTVEDTALEVAAVGVLANDSDIEADAMTAVLNDLPSHGVVVLNADGSFVYTPAANYNGPDSFTYHANDGVSDSALTTVNITVSPSNDAPAAVAQAVEVNEDGSVSLTLSGTDIDEDTLTYSFGTPAHGTLSGIAPDLTYQPNANYHGNDSFTFTVNDGTVDSEPSLVTITVAPVNDAPVGVADSYGTAEDTALEVVAVGVLANDGDIEADAMTAVLNDLPSHGVVVLNADGSFVYTPAANYNGPDLFTYHANDGASDSTLTTVNITVSPANDAPAAVAQSVEVSEDGSVSLTLSGTDIDEDTLTYSFGTPAHGTLSGTAPDLIYQPNANYHGSDSFTFTVNDGTVDSTSSLVTITVAPVNDAPVGVADSYITAEDTALTQIDGVLANDSDLDGDTLTVVLIDGPDHGTLVLEPDGKFTYTPSLNYNGPDSFAYEVSDGVLSSGATSVQISVSPVNDSAVASAQAINATEDTSVGLVVGASDSDGDSLIYTIGNPSHGTLTGTAPNLTYTPSANFHGDDSFSFTVSDGTVESLPAVVSIAVAAVNDAPIAAAQSLTLDEDTSSPVILAAQDVDGDGLTFTITTPPLHGTLSGTAPNLTYTPTADYNGPDSFSFVANDGTVDSGVAVVSIIVTPVDDNSFAEWLVTHGLGGGPGDDPDHDSINNAVEYVIGGNPANHSDTNLLPSISFVSADPDGDLTNSDYLLFTFRRTDLANTDPNTNIGVQWNTSLSGAWTNASGTSGVEIVENDNAAGVGIDLVLVYIPRSLATNGTIFARLAVSVENVASINLAPTAQSQSLSVNEDGSLPVTLSALDANNNPMTYALVDQPQHGTLSGTLPNLIYTPHLNYSGPDSFTFKASDGLADSSLATVLISVSPLEEFTQWMSTHSLAAGKTADSDGDSISNIMEYVIGGNPSTEDDADLLPTISMVTADPDGNSVNADYLLFTYRRTDLANADPGTGASVQWSSHLAGPWSEAAGTPGVVTIPGNDLAGEGVDVISVYLPRSLAAEGKLFARLSAFSVVP
jgi:large repetitive protein